MSTTKNIAYFFLFLCLHKTQARPHGQIKLYHLRGKPKFSKRNFGAQPADALSGYAKDKKHSASPGGANPIKKNKKMIEGLTRTSKDVDGTDGYQVDAGIVVNNLSLTKRWYVWPGAGIGGCDETRTDTNEGRG